MLSANDVRKQFIDFFVSKHGHTFVPSSSVVPLDDPTLMFTNAGMNQFKPIFLGQKRPDYPRAVNSQKCIRVSGKHNDLEEVGRDTYHHTFFEMLGNWSFGDYYKAEAIQWAWELLTKVWGIDKTRLHATVFGGDAEFGLEPDDEATRLWTSVTDIDPSHVHRFGKKDNFWMMGETGPCGPCSEIHIDRTPDKSGGKLVNAGDARVMEIWNLVFIQYNRDDAGKLTPLPAKHVDTGMGFERVTAVLQGKDSNYDTDVFLPIFEAIQKYTGARPYTGRLDDLKDTAYRVIADHVRALTIAIADGAVPSYEGRGYVLRRILRRAERYGRQYLGTTHPFLCELVFSVVDIMASAYPELKERAAEVMNRIEYEEESFLRTLDRGLGLFHEAAGRARSSGTRTISGEDAFNLHDTHGVYIDITEQMAREAGLHVDLKGFQERMRQAKELSRGAQKKVTITALEGDLPTTDDSLKYHLRKEEARIIGWVKDNRVIRSGRLQPGEQVALILDRTNFYAEQGGQVGDQGRIWNESGWAFHVTDTQKLGDCVLHIGSTEGEEEFDYLIEEDEKPEPLEVGQKVTVNVNWPRRWDTMRNHTATHLLNWALRRVLGKQIDQKGSLVDPDKTRFDFTYAGPLTQDDIMSVEQLVNKQIYDDLPVNSVIMPLDEAKRIPSVRAVFGEKYPDPVRVILIGLESPDHAALIDENYSVEFCGGTHLARTGQAGFFKIVSQEAVGKGIRRVTAVTGPQAVAVVQKQDAILTDVTARFRCKPEELPGRIESLQEEVKKLQQQLKKGAAADLQGTADKLLADSAEVGGTRIIVGEMPAGPEEQMRQQVDRLRQKAGSAVVVIGWSEDSKVQLIAAVTDDLVKKGVHAGKLVGQVAKVVGGGGGGKPTLAQAGGKDPDKLTEALDLAKKLAGEQLAK